MKTQRRSNKLTPNQSAALGMVSEGFRIKEIAEEWEVSETVVYRNIEAARKRLGARTNAHAVALWVTTAELAARTRSSNGTNGVHA